MARFNEVIIFPKEILNKISFSVSDPKSRSILIHFVRKAIKDPYTSPKITPQEIKYRIPGISKITEAEKLIEKLKRLSFVEERGGEFFLGAPLMSVITNRIENNADNISLISGSF